MRRCLPMLLLILSLIGASRSATAGTPGMIFEHNVPITVRDGTQLLADVFRPEAPGQYPVIILSGIYDKDAPWTTHAESGVTDTQGDDTYLNFEAPNPGFWIPQGYAIVHVAERGYGGSQGFATYLSEQEALDYYDSIEWAGTQSWSNGNVGMLGISYYTSNQYRVATLKPPHLKAMIAWEGGSDAYRDLSYQGGLFCTFSVWWYYFSVAPNRTEQLNSEKVFLGARHPLDDYYWQAKAADLSLIDVPILAVGQLSDYELHLRGTVNAYLESITPYKKMFLFNGTHWTQYYNSVGTNEQERFFDYWLKNIDNGLYNEPPIKMQVRTGPNSNDYILRYESEWPLARTQWTKLYLDTGKDPRIGALTRTTPKNSSSTKVLSMLQRPNTGVITGGEHPDGAWFTTEPLQQDTEITGPFMAQLWVSSVTDDLPVFLELQDIDENGEQVMFPFIVPGQRDEPVAKGWLLASERKLDKQKSTFYSPYHSHDEQQMLKPGEIVPLQVEFWPTSLVFKKGHRIRLQIRLDDYLRGPIAGTPDLPAALVPYLGPTLPGIDLSYHITPLVGGGQVYTGQDHPSYLLLPIIPASKSSM